MEKDPTNYTLLTYSWVLVLAVWGGTVNTIRNIKSGNRNSFSIAEWIGDIVIAGFIGLVTFFLCEYSGIDPMLSAVLIGISSHQGARGLMFIEQIVTKKAFIEVRLKEDKK